MLLDGTDRNAELLCYLCIRQTLHAQFNNFSLSPCQSFSWHMILPMLPDLLKHPTRKSRINPEISRLEMRNDAEKSFARFILEIGTRLTSTGSKQYISVWLRCQDDANAFWHVSKFKQKGLIDNDEVI